MNIYYLDFAVALGLSYFFLGEPLDVGCLSNEFLYGFFTSKLMPRKLFSLAIFHILELLNVP
nr:MAG TPA: hypothetical protein [Bacteriophage sp.]